MIDNIEGNQNFKKKIQTLEAEIKKLKKDLEKETKKNKEIINQMQDHFKSTMIKADISLIDQNEGLLINKDINFMKFYDVIIDIKSIQDITKGWEVKMSERAEKEYEIIKKGKIIKIGVIGNSNKGKSFLLSKISKIKLPSGTSIRTEGLSIKYPELDEYKNRKIALLDSCGLESPILIEDNFKGKDINEEKKEENNKEDKKDDNIISNEEDKIKDENEDDIKEEKNEENNKEENNIEEDNEEKLKLEKEELNEKKDIIKQNDKIKINGKVEINSKELFKIKSREKLITELFLQNYIIYNSDILIIVVGILTYSEQKLLHRIKIEIQKSKLNKQIYVIHNLMTYTSLKQIEEYINDYLLKSLTFKLEEGHKITTKKEELTGTYFYEVNTTPKIYHLIFANDGSEAGKYYNDFTLNFLENHFQEVTDLKPFDIIETVKERFIETYKEFIEKPEKSLKKSDFDNSNNKLIKLNSPKNIILKRCLIDELGFSSLRLNGFEPTYNYYLKDDKIFVRLEAPGNCTISSTTEYSGEYTIIKLSGEKKPDKEQDKIHTLFFNNREIGKFSLELPIKSEEDYIIKNEDPTVTNKKGLLELVYLVEKKKNTFNYEYKEEEEV